MKENKTSKQREKQEKRGMHQECQVLSGNENDWRKEGEGLCNSGCSISELTPREKEKPARRDLGGQPRPRLLRSWEEGTVDRGQVGVNGKRVRRRGGAGECPRTPGEEQEALGGCSEDTIKFTVRISLWLVCGKWPGHLCA